MKTRKVGSRDVEFLSDLLRYRLVGYGVGMEKAKKLFELKVDQGTTSEEGDNKNLLQDPWKKQYMTMK